VNENQIKGKWNEIKGEIISQWGKLTEDEVIKTKGNITSVIGLIEQKYGSKKEEIQGKMNQIVAKFSAEVENAKEKLKDKK